MKTQLWQHSTSGEKYVVVVDTDGVVVQATGPLHHSEIDTALRGDFDSNPELVDDLNADTDSYMVR